jgi:xanthine dehydrogenase small subunit
MSVRFVLNGRRVQVDRIEPHVSLLEWLRTSGLPGSKEGCAEGECGACAVAVLCEDTRGRARFEAVNSCLVPLVALHDRQIVTVEGVAAENGELHPVQRALLETGSSQCGYCTPGFVISLFCEYYRPGRTGYDPEGISGNLCRCTGYRPIADAARSLGAPVANDPHLAVLEHTPEPANAFEHAGADQRFVRPTRLAAALEELARTPESVPMTGGTDLMVYSNLQDRRARGVVALDAVAELVHLDVRPHELVIGAGLSLSELQERLRLELPSEFPLLADMLRLFASRLIRNRATLGGNLATASPIGDSAPALLALDARVTLVSARAERTLPLHTFFTGYRKTALAPGELIRSVHLPRPPPKQQRFYKVSKRELDDISTVVAAFTLELDSDGCVSELRAAYGGIAQTPLRAERVEEKARGLPWGRDTLALLAPELETLGSPISDHRGSAAYRRALIGRLFEKFFVETTAGLEAAE